MCARAVARLPVKTVAAVGGGIRARSASNLSKFASLYRRFWGYEISDPKPPYEHVCQVGDPILRATAEPVPIDKIKSQEIQKVISAMKSALKYYDCVGLAAPQIGVPLRIILIELSSANLKSVNPEMRRIWEMATCPPQLIINPTMTVLDHRTSVFSEGCESVRGFSASVKRFQAVRVDGLNEAGDPYTWTTKGWLARIVQHEVDHINGRIYTDIMDTTTFQCDHWYVVNYKKGRYRMRYK